MLSARLPARQNTDRSFAGRLMIDCSDLLEHYSEYRDGLLDERRLRAFRKHLEDCRRCARYDRVVRGGVEILRAADPVRPSEDFRPRLEHRIYHLRDEEYGAGTLNRATSPLALAAIAAVIAAAAWLPVLMPKSPPAFSLPPAQAHAPHPRPVPPSLLFEQRPIFADRSPHASSSASLVPLPVSNLFFEYSPLNAYTLRTSNATRVQSR